MQRHDWYLKEKWIERLNSVDLTNIHTYHNELMLEIQKHIPYNIVLTPNATSALYLGMYTLNLKENDEIIIPAYGYNAVHNLAKLLKLSIKFCDIDLTTFCMDPISLKKIITPNTKVVCFINHLGYVGDALLEIQNICKTHDVLFFEDSAQGLCQTYNNRVAGSFGEFGVISFSGSKTISTGEGGLLFSSNKQLIEYVQRLQDVETDIGIGNYTMSALVKYILLQQFKDIDWILDNKVRLFNTYKNMLNVCEPFQADKFIGYNSIVYRSNTANKIHTTLRDKYDIMTRYQTYPAIELLPNAVELYNTYLELPQIFSLTDLDIKKVVMYLKTIR